MKLTVTTTRTGNAGAALKKLNGRLLERAKEATQAVALMLMEESAQQAPEDTGALKASRYMSDEAQVINGRVTSRFGFGKEGFVYTGPDKRGIIRTRKPFEYAIWVHERIEAAKHGGRFDFINVALELRTRDIKLIVRNIMMRK